MKINLQGEFAGIVARIVAILLLCAGCPERTNAGSPECAAGVIVSVSPPNGTLDARSPYDPDSGLLIGIGNAAERILVYLVLDEPNAPPATQLSCWHLCETATGEYEPNSVQGVTYLGSDQYAIKLHRAITPNGATTVRYAGDRSNVITYISHPGNIDGSAFATVFDVLYLIDLLNGAVMNDDGIFRQDINRNGGFGGGDILGTIDLLNGVQGHEPQLLTQRPDASPCEGVAGCGDGVVDDGEQCDPPDGITCTELCLVAADDCCLGEGQPGCGNSFCADCVCANDPYCCEISWDHLCADIAIESCQDVCPCNG